MTSDVTTFTELQHIYKSNDELRILMRRSDALLESTKSYFLAHALKKIKLVYDPEDEPRVWIHYVQQLPDGFLVVVAEAERNDYTNDDDIYIYITM